RTTSASSVSGLRASPRATSTTTVCPTRIGPAPWSNAPAQDRSTVRARISTRRSRAYTVRGTETSVRGLLRRSRPPPYVPSIMMRSIASYHLRRAGQTAVQRDLVGGREGAEGHAEAPGELPGRLVDPAHPRQQPQHPRPLRRQMRRVQPQVQVGVDRWRIVAHHERAPEADAQGLGPHPPRGVARTPALASHLPQLEPPAKLARASEV